MPLQQLQRFPGVCGTVSLALGEGSRSAAGLCLGARCASVLGCPQRGVTLGTGAPEPARPGKVRGAAPAAGTGRG